MYISFKNHYLFVMKIIYKSLSACVQHHLLITVCVYKSKSMPPSKRNNKDDDVRT